MPPTRTIEVLPTPEGLFHAAANNFVNVGTAAIAARGRFTVALAGGSTPKGMYSLLAQKHARFNWRQTYIFFSDERHVPPDHPDSNYRMANETLLSKVPIPVSNVFRIPAELEAVPAANRYVQKLEAFFDLSPDTVPRFDLILLGLGPDGHTTSLFPGSRALKDASMVFANWVDKFKSYRITFTYPVLNRAAEVMFLVSGPDKAEILREVLKPSPPVNYPAQGVQPSNGRLLWIVDQAAAKML